MKFTKLMKELLVINLEQRGFKNIEENFEMVFEDIIVQFEIHGAFLDNIIISKQYSNNEKSHDIVDIVNWIIFFVLSPMDEIYNTVIIKKNTDLGKRYLEPSKAIKRDIGIIEKFENMLEDRFSYVLKQSETSSTKEIEDQEVILKIKNLLSLTEELKQDLSAKEFNIFSRDEYYKISSVSKQDLNRLLDKIIKKYAIKSCTVDKKNLVDSLPYISSNEKAVEYLIDNTFLRN